MSEKLSNNAATTLSGGINNTDLTLTVASGTGFPATGNFRIKIELELLLVTNVAGTTWTVTRGIEGTTAASHGSSTPVIHVLTEKGLETYIGDYIGGGTISSLPASEKAGKLYLPDDGYALLRDNGSSWQGFGPMWRFVTPVDSGYSWANQQSAVLTARNDGLLLNAGTAASTTFSIRGRVKNRLGTSTGYKLTVGMMSMLDPANYAMAGCGLYESSSGKAEIILCESDSGVPQSRMVRASTLQSGTITGLGTTTQFGSYGSFPQIHWMQIEQTSTNLVYRYSPNRLDWFDLRSHSITESFSAAPDQFILHVVPYSQKCRALYVSVNEET